MGEDQHRRPPRPGTAAPERPTVLGVGLGGELRRLREHAGFTRDAAAAAGDLPVTAVDQVEQGVVDERTVAGLLTGYGVGDGVQRTELLTLARRAVEPGWWHDYADMLPLQQVTYLRLEQAATMIRTYDRQVVPRLLQTADYARTVARLAMATPEQIEGMIEVRAHRLEVTLGAGRTLWAVVDEAALRRPVGDRELAVAQIEHLLEMNEQPDLTLQIAPAGTADHAPVSSSLTIVRFAEPYVPDVVYVEQATRALCLSKRPDVEFYTMFMDRLVGRIPPPARTTALLGRIRDET